MTAPRTLLVGETHRTGITTVPPSEVPRIEGQFAEIVVEPELQEVEDAWSLLRTLHERCLPGAVLTVAGAAYALSALTRLAGFEPFREDTFGSTTRVRAHAVARVQRTLDCSIIVPCRDEVDNIEPLVRRLPRLPGKTEVLFVDGASTDGTPVRIQSVIERHPEQNIRLLHQDGGRGKADAVFQGFDRATGDILIILDADMAVAPEDLPRFYLALAEGVARFASGTRFVYGMEPDAMPRANRLGNRAFSRTMSWLTSHSLSDTLCGTKALFREDWERLRGVRPLFGYHDRWGDFDLLLGAAYLRIPLVEVPVSYRARVAGASKMRAFHDAPDLMRTVVRGAMSVKFGAGYPKLPRP